MTIRARTSAEVIDKSGQRDKTPFTSASCKEADLWPIGNDENADDT